MASSVQHPCSSFITAAVTTAHSHPPSYHSFVASPFFSAIVTSSSSNKRGNRTSATCSLPPLISSSDSIPVRSLHEKVLVWYDAVKNDRGMPWRVEVADHELLSAEARSQRGYEVWVSEIMLQQTQVATVIEYYKRWMVAFPTLKSLAGADIEQVNALWKGLGYYSRAQRLLAGAKTVLREFGGSMPQSPSELEKIDGIGPYSAGAISSIAFHKRSAMVDGNVSRVLSRLVSLHAPPTAKATTNFIWALADTLVPSASPLAGEALLLPGGPNKPGAWNQALMELGATVCTPKNPNCDDCPLSEFCLARAEVRQLGIAVGGKSQSEDIEDICSLCTPFTPSANDFAVTQYPQAKERKRAREEETAVCILEWVPSGTAGDNEKKQILFVKRPEKGLLAGLFEFPAVDLPTDVDSTPATRKKHIHSLVSSLLVDTFPPLHLASNPRSTLSIVEVQDLTSILQVYSHQKREYHILRVVVSSPALPVLASEIATKGTQRKLVQSVVGRAKWVDEDSVEGSNVGGAVQKVWEMRQGGGSGKKVPAKRKAKKVETVGNKVAPREESEEASEEEPPKVVTPRKKRRIIISESEDDQQCLL